MQGLIYKHIERTFNFKYIDKLQDIIETYNNRKHRMTKLSPSEGDKKENSLHIQEMQEDYRRKIKPTEKVKFEVGDQVRIAIAKGAFSRGYNQKSKEEIYKVVKVSRKLPRVLYLLTTLNGENVEGKFYQEQLTKVLDQDEFIVEEFLEENDTHYKVKFQGYDEHEWLPKENVTNTIKDIL